MIVDLLAAAALAGLASQPSTLLQQAAHPLWQVTNDGENLAAVDRGPVRSSPVAPVDINYWIFMPEADGVDAIVSAMTVDCAARTFVHHSFSGYHGTSFVGASAATDTSAQTAEADTLFGAMVAHVCDPQPEGREAPDFGSYRDAVTARQELARP